jgi:hypothetical protein
LPLLRIVYGDESVVRPRGEGDEDLILAGEASTLIQLASSFPLPFANSPEFEALRELSRRAECRVAAVGCIPTELFAIWFENGECVGQLKNAPDGARIEAPERLLPKVHVEDPVEFLNEALGMGIYESNDECRRTGYELDTTAFHERAHPLARSGLEQGDLVLELDEGSVRVRLQEVVEVPHNPFDKKPVGVRRADGRLLRVGDPALLAEFAHLTLPAEPPRSLWQRLFRR